MLRFFFQMAVMAEGGLANARECLVEERAASPVETTSVTASALPVPVTSSGAPVYGFPRKELPKTESYRFVGAPRDSYGTGASFL